MDSEYDIFVSYSHEDGEWVRTWLVPRLERANLRICIDFRDFDLGQAILINIEQAVERSARVLLVMTPSWRASEWGRLEALLIGTDDPSGTEGRILPLLLQPCDLPKHLAIRTHVDFTVPDQWEFGLQRIIDSFPPIAALSSPFQTAGPLPFNARSYVKRECDDELERSLSTHSLIALYGEYRIGKTSLLVQVQNMFGNDWKVIIRDLSRMRTDNEGLFIDGFFRMMSENFGQVDTWDELIGHLRRERMIILMDEFGILSPEVARIFVPRLCLLADEVGDQIRIIITLPSTISAFFESRRVDNPKFLPYWKSIFIPYLDDDGIHQLIKLLPEPIYRVTYQYRNLIAEYSESHPCKVQCLCEKLFDLPQSRLIPEDIVRMISDVENYNG